MHYCQIKLIFYFLFRQPVYTCKFMIVLIGNPCRYGQSVHTNGFKCFEFI